MPPIGMSVEVQLEKNFCALAKPVQATMVALGLPARTQAQLATRVWPDAKSIAVPRVPAWNSQLSRARLLGLEMVGLPATWF